MGMIRVVEGVTVLVIHYAAAIERQVQQLEGSEDTVSMHAIRKGVQDVLVVHKTKKSSNHACEQGNCGAMRSINPTRPLSQTSLVTWAQTLSSAYIRYKRQHAPHHLQSLIFLSHLRLLGRR